MGEQRTFWKENFMFLVENMCKTSTVPHLRDSQVPSVWVCGAIEKKCAPQKSKTLFAFSQSFCRATWGCGGWYCLGGKRKIRELTEKLSGFGQVPAGFLSIDSSNSQLFYRTFSFHERAFSTGKFPKWLTWHCSCLSLNKLQNLFFTMAELIHSEMLMPMNIYLPNSKVMIGILNSHNSKKIWNRFLISSSMGIRCEYEILLQALLQAIQSPVFALRIWFELLSTIFFSINYVQIFCMRLGYIANR